MIKEPTVLILGAGASQHLGYPIGSELINSICKIPQNEVVCIILNDLIAGEHTIEEFITHLSRSGYYSIDSFLENNQDMISIGKMLITYCIKKCEIPTKLFPPGNPGWYKYLFNSLAPDNPRNFWRNKLKIITFNYDRSIEYFLHQSIMYRYKIGEKKALNLLKHIEIIHIHGMIGNYPEVSYTVSYESEDLLVKQNLIKIIHELNDADDIFCTPEYKKANDALNDAKNIYFLGFGFHEDNMRRFKFFNKKARIFKNFHSTTKGLESAERWRLVYRLEKYGLSEYNFPKDKCNCEMFFRRHVSLR